MAESRQKTASLLLSIEGKDGLKPLSSLELFPCEQWGDQPCGAGLYRVRVNGKWHSPNGEKYCFLTPAVIGSLISGQLDGLAEQPASEPLLPAKGRVCVPVEYHEGLPLYYTQGYTETPPHMGVDGRWWVWVFNGECVQEYPCEDVICVKISRKGAKK